MIVNLLVLAAVATVAAFGAMQRLYRAAQMLVALILAGALASTLAGPLAGVISASSNNPDSTWYYVGDAICLWGILCAALLGLRTAGHRLLPNTPPLPTVASQAGGAVVGALAGYLAVGLCLMIVQMLPVAPAPLGYEPFRYLEGTSRASPERVVHGDTAWLAPDRSAIWLFDTITGGGAAPEGGALLARYGDTYPPPRMRPQDYAPAVNVDDFLYFHWYRRWLAVRWRTGQALGPVPEVPSGAPGEHGLAVAHKHRETLYGMQLKTYPAERSASITGFPGIEPPEGKEFLKVRIQMEPETRLPRAIDSAQFYLVDEAGGRLAGAPMVLGEAQMNQEGQPEPVSTSVSPQTTPRNTRFAFPDGSREDACLCTGMRFLFTEPRHRDAKFFVFAVPKATATRAIRLLLDPRVPPTAELNEEGWPEKADPDKPPPPQGHREQRSGSGAPGT